MLQVSNAERVVFPAVGKTKGDVVDYYARIALRMLPHVAGRPLSIRRFPKGLAAPGFFQKNVPPHYPASIERFPLPRSQAASKRHRDPKNAESDVTLYPLLSEPEQLAYLANQGAIELHAPTTRARDLAHADRLVIDLDPPRGELALTRRAAHYVREELARHGVPTVPVATGSKGYHVVAAILPTVNVETLALTAQKLSALLAARHADELTISYRINQRGQRVFLDWLRNMPAAHAIVPYSLRATEKASLALPLAWEELEHTAPDAFTIAELEQVCARPDSLAELARAPVDVRPLVQGVDEAFTRSGLVLEPFDRFRS